MNMKEIDSKELSKSLVAGNMDSLPYYKQSIKSKPRGCRTFPIMVTLLAVGFIVWLAGLTFVSQWQISNLETETAALKVNIEMLKLKIAENDRVNDVKIFQHSVYADPLDRGSNSEENDDVEFAGDVDEEPLKKIYGTISKFPGVFQIDTEDAEDDNDNNDDDDYGYPGSGDWSYLDYDTNRPADDEDQTSNAGNHLPDDEDSDFLGKVMEGRSQEDSEKTNQSNIKKIMKIMPEDEVIHKNVEDRSKRQADTTKGGLKIHAKSYKETHVTTKPEHKSEKNLSIYEKVAASKVSSGNRQKRHQYLSDTTLSDESIDDKPVLPAMLHRPNELTDEAVLPAMLSRPMQANSKFLRKAAAAPSIFRAARESDYDDFEEEYTTTTAAPPRRRMHQRQRIKVKAGAGQGGLVAAHFAANTSHLEVGKHPNYHGNGLLSLPHEATHASWREAAWLPALSADRHFRLDADSGVIHVKLDGIYFVYAQIYFQDHRDTNSFKVLRNDVESILHCTTTSISSTRETKANTCFTAAATALRAGDRLAVRNVGGERFSIMTPEKSFIGLIKLGDHGAI